MRPARTACTLLCVLALGACTSGDDTVGTATSPPREVSGPFCVGPNHVLDRDYEGTSADEAVRAESPWLLGLAGRPLIYERLDASGGHATYAVRDGEKTVGLMSVVDRPGRSGVEAYERCTA